VVARLGLESGFQPSNFSGRSMGEMGQLVQAQRLETLGGTVRSTAKVPFLVSSDILL